MRSLLIVRLAALALCVIYCFAPLLEFPEPGAGRNSFFAISGQYLHFTGLYLTLGTRVLEGDRLTVPAKVEKNWIGGDAAMSLLLLLPLFWFALSLIPRPSEIRGADRADPERGLPDVPADVRQPDRGPRLQHRDSALRVAGHVLPRSWDHAVGPRRPGGRRIQRGLPDPPARAGPGHAVWRRGLSQSAKASRHGIVF